MVTINPQKIEGNWRSGTALDLHTLGSTHVGQDQFGHDRFESQRSPLGELLYRLKYKSDRTAAPDIITAAAEFLKPHISKVDLIVPVPASRVRAIQPVTLIANGIGEVLHIPVLDCITATRAIPQQLKNIQDPEQRKQLLSGLHTVNPALTANKKILLFDDLFRSGSTMNEITDVLMGIGRASVVRALTITCTRSNR